MSLFLTLLLTFTLGMAGVAVFMVWWMQKVTHAAISSKFKAAEHILNQHTAPPNWLRPKNPILRLWQNVPVFPGAERANNPHAKVRLLHQLDELIAYFESSPFFDEPETREEMLGQLNDERESWQEKTVTEIIGH